MTSLASARRDLVQLKVQLLSATKTKAQLLESNPSANTATIQSTIDGLQAQIVDQSIVVRQLSGMLNNTVVLPSSSSPSSSQVQSLSVGNLTAVDATVSGNLDVNGAQWASSVIYGTTTPFTYTGPGSAYTNGVPFFSQVLAKGTPIVTPSGNNNSVFSVTTTGTYMVQSEVGVAYPWMPDGADTTTYYVVNADASLPYGREVHPSTGFACTRPLVLNLDANDNVRFLIESSAGHEYEVGLESAKLTFLKLA